MTNLHFDVSSGLKSVLGSELITNDEVAIFELVKNSFDADARQVDLFFGDDRIIVSDDGIGMSYDDINKKWLFVAFSSKRGKDDKSGDFRDDIAKQKHYAGSKGIGRFSSDRLGQIIKLQTRHQSEVSGPVHSITVDWSLFDVNHLKHFEKIDISYTKLSSWSPLPSELPKLSHGTVIAVEKTRRVWTRDSILRLKSALAKLINPFGVEADGFRIAIHAPAERSLDCIELDLAKRKGDEVSPNSIVNGEVGNFIFSTLQEKTTFITVRIDPQNNSIESSLTDRGELIYRVREPNSYPLLVPSGFQCQLYFLNQSAKLTFARRMGVPSVQFGSVFLFRNGFRVFPIGEEGDDWYGMDRRKQQGYARFLGSRDVIGRIDVFGGADSEFQESSSRNTGLIETPSVDELRRCFVEHCLKRLERYVVPVTFVDKADKNTSDISRLLTDPGRARVAAVVAKLVDNKDVDLLEYSKSLIGIINERSSQFESSLGSLRSIAEKTKDSVLFQSIEEAEKRFEELRRAEEVARRQADEERAAKWTALERVHEAEKVVEHVTVQLAEEKKRNLFLSSISTLDTDTILNLHHQVTIYAVDIQQQIENFLVRISDQSSVAREEVLNALEQVSLLNRKVMGISKFATKANFRLKSEQIEAVLANYIEQYINDVARIFSHGPLMIEVENDGKGFIQKFKPIDVSVIIDNLIANSKKKQTKATKITFKITHPSKDIIHVLVTDNGRRGFDKQIDDLDRMFEKGFTLTDGAGLGLYHVRHVLGEMNGTIEAMRTKDHQGAMFLIRISK